MASTFDQFVKEHIGRLGLWHIAFIVTLLMSTNVSLQFFTQFAFMTPHHHCRQPLLENLSWPRPDILNLSIPVKPDAQAPPMVGQTFQPCLEYDLDALWPHITRNTSLEEAILLRDRLLPNLTTRSCNDGVSFDEATAVIPGSFGEEFEIVCDRRHFIPLSNIVYIIGMMIGLVLPGPLSDRFGRRPVCLLMPLGGILSGLGTALVSNLWLFVVLRFVTAVCSTTAFLTAVVLVSEWIDADQRNAFSFMRKIYLGLVSRLFLLLCFFVMPSWRSAYASYFILTAPIISGYFLWKESPRWLLSHGRLQDTHALIVKILRWNRRPLFPEAVAAMKDDLAVISATMQSGRSQQEEASEDDQSAEPSSFVKSVGYIFRIRKFRRSMLLMLVVWPMQAFTYYGLNFNAVRLGGNPFLIALFTSLTSLPGNFIQYIVYRLFDRKWPMTILYLLSSVALLTAFILQLVGHHGSPLVAVCTIGLICSDALFTMLYIRTPEIFPTAVRTTSIGLCSGVARVGMVLAAYVERLDEMVWKPLPMLIFFVASLIAAIASAFLPAGEGEMKEWEEEELKPRNEMEMREEDSDASDSSIPNIQFRHVYTPVTS